MSWCIIHLHLKKLSASRWNSKSDPTVLITARFVFRQFLVFSVWRKSLIKMYYYLERFFLLGLEADELPAFFLFKMPQIIFYKSHPFIS